MTKNIIFTIFLILAVLGLGGCGKRAPKGLPPLVPCSITIIDGGKPVPNVDISFLREEGAGWAMNAKTNSSGVAVAQTILGEFSGKGIPAGKYRIVLGQRVDIPPELNPDVMTPKITAEREKYVNERRTLPPLVCSVKDTPLELNVESPKCEVTFDVTEYHGATGKTK